MSLHETDTCTAKVAEVLPMSTAATLPTITNNRCLAEVTVLALVLRLVAQIEQGAPDCSLLWKDRQVRSFPS